MSRTIRNFSEMLGLLSRGRFNERLDQELTEAIQVLSNLPNEKGKATISLTIELSYQGGRLDIKPTVKSKLPEGQAFADTPFWTFENGLSVQHPSQIDIFDGPRDVSKTA
jgi:hypothetical protein